MHGPRNVGPTVEVVDNILILDEHNQVVYCGKGIQGLLCPSAPSEDRGLLNHVPDEDDRRELADGIDQVRETRIPVCVPLKGLAQSLYVFPDSR